eukprot:5550767-Pyramimonas_sp.AAC.1
MDTSMALHVSDENLLLRKKRHRDAVVLRPSDEGDVAVRTRVGGVMGDPVMVAAFSTTFQRP